jgi:RNA polymerase primary sigma factor
MTKTPKTLTLSVKKPTRASSAPLVVPKTTLSYVIDNAQEAASKVTVVKKKTRLSAAAEAAELAQAEALAAEEGEAPAKQVKVARKSAAASAAAADEASTPAVVVKAAPKSKLVKAKVEPAPVVIVTAGPAVSQVTDAATLASIDTSGYLLPSIKVPGRRGRKPSEFTPENDEVAALNAVERAELKAVSKARERKAKGGAADMLGVDPKSSAEDLERRRNQIKNLINMGKERGFLTYAEINDQLPENIVDPEAIEGIIATFNDMGIAIYERAPEADSLLLTDSVATVTSDDEVEAAAATALSTVDSDFGRTTDPVRMYMREMGAVALLTREGEIEIAKRIEGGLKDMIQAISACPTTIAEIVALARKIEADELKVDEVVDGFVDLNEANNAPAVGRR